MLYFSSACDAQSTASCCISSLISAFFITALRSAMVMIGWVKISRRLRSSVSSASPSETRVTAASMASLSTACYCATAAGLLLLLLRHYDTASATAAVAPTTPTMPLWHYVCYCCSGYYYSYYATIPLLRLLLHCYWSRRFWNLKRSGTELNFRLQLSTSVYPTSHVLHWTRTLHWTMAKW